MGRGLTAPYHFRGEKVDKQVLLKLLKHYNEMLLERIAYLENRLEEYNNLRAGCKALEIDTTKIKNEISDCKLNRYTTIAHIQILEKEVE